MNALVRYILIGSALVVGLDAIYASISLYSHIAYPWFALPQIAFYAVLAWVVASNRANWRAGAVAALFVSIVESTLGWWVSWLIGPGRPPVHEPVMLITGVLFAIASCSIIGTISALLAVRQLKGRSNTLT